LELPYQHGIDPFIPRDFEPVGKPSGKAMVLVHGFTGAPWDLFPLAEALANVGHRVRVPLLTGHEQGWQGIAQARLVDWRRDVERAVRSLEEDTGGKIWIGGLSMGALLSLDVATRAVTTPMGLISMAAPLSLGRGARTAAKLVLRAGKKAEAFMAWPKLGGADIQSRQPLPGAEAIPFRALHELIVLMDEVRGNLDKVRVPLLIMHSRLDHTAPPVSALQMARGVSSPLLRMVILTEGFHVLTRDICRERVIAEVSSMLEVNHQQV
jgi:carboxylesterase